MKATHTKELRLAVIATVLLTSALSAQYDVDSLEDNGPWPNLIPNTLRWAIQMVVDNPTPSATINIKVSGAVVLKTETLPDGAVPAGTALTIQTVPPFPAGQRLTIDATGVTATASGAGLTIRGANSSITVPLTIQVTKGVGMKVHADNVTVSDLEVQGADQAGLLLTGAPADPTSGFSVHRLLVDGARNGVHLMEAAGASIGLATGPRVELTSCWGAGLLVEGGQDNSVPWFLSAGNANGALILGGTNLLLGSPSAGRSTVTGSGSHGMQIKGGAVQTRVSNADITQNGGNGIVVADSSTSETTLTDLTLDGNSVTGILIQTGANKTTVGPDVVCMHATGADSRGITVLQSSDTQITGSEFSENRIGISITAGAQGLAITSSAAMRNDYGISAVGQGDLVLAVLEVKQNYFNGIDLTGCPRTWISNSDVSDNIGVGIRVAEDSEQVILGPGNTTLDNTAQGVFILDSAGCQILDSTISDNSAPGIQLEEAPGTIVRGNVVERNRAYGIAVFFNSDNCFIGGNSVRDTVGVGIKLELVDAARVEANQVLGASAAGIGIVKAGNLGLDHVLISNLIDGESSSGRSAVGIAVREPAGVTKIVACTIVNNVRGIHVTSENDPGDHVVDVDSCILWNNTTDDFSSSQGLVTASYSIMQDPAGTGTNSSADPGFVDSVAGNWSLGIGSPAIDGANPATAGTYGLSLYDDDAADDDRVVNGSMDIGALERQYISAVPDTMPATGPGGTNGGGDVDFTIEYPSSLAGNCSFIFMSITPAREAFPFVYLSAYIPITPDALTFAPVFLDPVLCPKMWGIQGTPASPVITTIPADGRVEASIHWTGLLPPGFVGIRFRAFGIAMVDCFNPIPSFVTGPTVITLR